MARRRRRLSRPAGSPPSCGRRRRGAAADRAALCRRAGGAGSAGGRRGRHADRAAGAHRPRRPRGRERGAAAARRAAIVGVLGAVARGDLRRRLRGRLRPRARKRPIRRARCRSSCSTSRRKSARSTRCCAPIPPRRRACSRCIPRSRSGGSTATARSTEPKKVKSRPYEPGLALRRGLLIAAGLAGRRGERRAAEGRRPRRSARCARLRRDRAAHASRRGQAVSRSAAARRVRTADGDLGVMARSVADRHAASEHLIEGYRAFRSGRLRAEQDRYRELAETGQSPEVMVIGCCDSRVSPEVIFDARPGELFVVRNVANLVPPYAPDGAQHGVSAALEFAVAGAEGEAHRGARPRALRRHPRLRRADGAPLSPGDFIGKWMSLIAPAAEAVGPASRFTLARRLSRRAWSRSSIANTLDNLMTFPVRAHAGRARQAVAARRVFRRGDRASFRCSIPNGKFTPVERAIRTAWQRSMSSSLEASSTPPSASPGSACG